MTHRHVPPISEPASGFCKLTPISTLKINEEQTSKGSEFGFSSNKQPKFWMLI